MSIRSRIRHSSNIKTQASMIISQPFQQSITNIIVQRCQKIQLQIQKSSKLYKHTNNNNNNSNKNNQLLLLMVALDKDLQLLSKNHYNYYRIMALVCNTKSSYHVYSMNDSSYEQALQYIDQAMQYEKIGKLGNIDRARTLLNKSVILGQLARSNHNNSNIDINSNCNNTGQQQNNKDITNSNVEISIMNKSQGSPTKQKLTQINLYSHQTAIGLAKQALVLLKNQSKMPTANIHNKQQQYKMIQIIIISLHNIATQMSYLPYNKHQVYLLYKKAYDMAVRILGTKHSLTIHLKYIVADCKLSMNSNRKQQQCDDGEGKLRGNSQGQCNIQISENKSKSKNIKKDNSKGANKRRVITECVNTNSQQQHLNNEQTIRQPSHHNLSIDQPIHIINNNNSRYHKKQISSKRFNMKSRSSVESDNPKYRSFFKIYGCKNNNSNNNSNIGGSYKKHTFKNMGSNLNIQQQCQQTYQMHDLSKIEKIYNPSLASASKPSKSSKNNKNRRQNRVHLPHVSTQQQQQPQLNSSSSTINKPIRQIIKQGKILSNSRPKYQNTQQKRPTTKQQQQQQQQQIKVQPNNTKCNNNNNTKCNNNNNTKNNNNNNNNNNNVNTNINDDGQQGGIKQNGNSECQLI